MIGEEFLWVEKYRPRTVAECILPKRLKDVFQGYVDKGEIDNITLAGSAGVGKTTVAKAMCNELGSDFYMINGSLDRNIDTLRNEIQTFASAMSLTGGRKYVILDEADNLNPQSVQPALRAFIETYGKNCGFIFTCNFKNKILEPLHSRAPILDINLKKAELPKLAGQFLARACMILEKEGIEHDKKVVAEVIMMHMPDWRRVLGELQRYSATGRIDAGILTNFSDASFNALVDSMKAKKFTEVRKWVAENHDIDPTMLFRKFYDTVSQRFQDISIPTLILLIAKYQYQAAHVNDPEINLAAFFVEVMVECAFR